MLNFHNPHMYNLICESSYASKSIRIKYLFPYFPYYANIFVVEGHILFQESIRASHLVHECLTAFYRRKLDVIGTFGTFGTYGRR